MTPPKPVTSVALEPTFWLLVEQEAARLKTTVPRLIAAIDDQRKHDRRGLALPPAAAATR